MDLQKRVVGWLVGWLVGLLVGWFVSWLVGWLGERTHTMAYTTVHKKGFIQLSSSHLEKHINHEMPLQNQHEVIMWMKLDENRCNKSLRKLM